MKANVTSLVPKHLIYFMQQIAAIKSLDNSCVYLSYIRDL